MIYPFKCKCGIIMEIVRHHSEAGLPYNCPQCGEEMKRIWTVPQVKVYGGMEFNPGLGKFVRGQAGVRDALREHKDKTGQELIEVGNEKIKTKSKAGKYEFSHADMKEMHQTLEGAK